MNIDADEGRSRVEQNDHGGKQMNAEGRKRPKKPGGFCPSEAPSQAEIRHHRSQKRLQEHFFLAEVPSLSHPQLRQPGNPVLHHHPSPVPFSNPFGLLLASGRRFSPRLFATCDSRGPLDIGPTLTPAPLQADLCPKAVASGPVGGFVPQSRGH